MFKKTFATILIAATLLLAGGASAGAQAAYRKGSGEYAMHNLVWPKKLRMQIEFLSSDICQGRGIGSTGHAESAFWIMREFRRCGLMPVNGSLSHHFYPGKGFIGHNIIGLMPGSKKASRDSYVIVMAHYDGIGTIDGTTYPGADSNSSGVTAMISIAEMFNFAKTMGRSFNSNILFVALDAKELSLAGSADLWKKLSQGELTDPISGKPITAKSVKLVVNIDQIGCSLSPLKSGNPDYMIMLGSNSLTQHQRELTGQINTLYGTDLELSYSYYGSDKFTEMFYKRVCDQKVFVEHKKSAVLFTSGITMNNNKPRDTVDTINYEVLKKRIIFIYHWLEKMI